MEICWHVYLDRACECVFCILSNHCNVVKEFMEYSTYWLCGATVLPLETERRL